MWECIFVWSLTTARNQILILYYATYHQMWGMFFEAEAFNQQLDFNTTKVTNVRVYLFGVRLQQWETWFWFSTFHPIHSYPTYHQMFFLFGGASAFNQPIAFDTAEVTYVRLYDCLGSDFNNVKPDSDFLFSTQFIRCTTCSKTQRPSINHCLSILLRLQMWE